LLLVLVISCLGGHGALGQTNDNKFISHLLKGCSVNNGGCEHVCIRTDPHSCRCRKGYVINDDGRTCSANIAVGRATLQSSTDEGGNSARAVDGNMATDWSEESCTHTKPEAKPWLRIDFGQARKVGKVILYNRNDCCSERLNYFKITVGNHPNGTDNAICVGNGGNVKDKTKIIVYCNRPVEGRYMHIQLIRGGILSLCEVQAFESRDPYKDVCQYQGYCLTPEGEDANDTLLARGVTPDQCLNLCRGKQYARGCEWHTSGKCTIHMEEVATGNRGGEHTCWQFSKYSVVQLERGKVFRRNITINKQYTISFDLLPTKFKGGYHNVLHFTTGDNYNTNGSRVPGVWFHDKKGNSKERVLMVCSEINDNHNHCTLTKKLPVNQWTSIKIQQAKKGRVYMYLVYVNGDLIKWVINKKPRVYRDVVLYTADPWHDAQQGFIRDLHFPSDLCKKVSFA